MTTYPFLNSQAFNEFIMNAGSYQDLVFDIYGSGSVSGCAILNLNATNFTLRAAPYGSTNVVLTKTGVWSGSPTNEYHVYLDDSDTATLGGKYIYQCTLGSFSGSSYVLGNGLIQITPVIS